MSPRPDTEVQTSWLETQLSFDSVDQTCENSIGHFPAFHFNLHTICPLSLITHYTGHRCTDKVNLLVAVLEVDGPDWVRIRKGPEMGTEVGVMKLVIGDQAGGVARVTAWRETAEVWGGQDGNTVAVAKGDIVFLQSIFRFSSLVFLSFR